MAMSSALQHDILSTPVKFFGGRESCMTEGSLDFPSKEKMFLQLVERASWS
jgi:hypothetical protein